MLIPFEKGFEDDAFGRVGNVFHRGDHLHAVVFERFFMDRRFVFIPGKPVELVNGREERKSDTRICSKSAKDGQRSRPIEHL